MKTTRLVAVLVGLATISLFAADATAMYHPTMGRFLQRDPGPGASGPARVGTAGPAVGGGFIPRDQYADGMNLYQYVGANPTGWVDPDGATRVNIVSTHTTNLDYLRWALSDGTTYKIGTVKDKAGKVTSDPGVQLAEILEKYQGCISELNLSGHAYGAGISTEEGWKSGINQNLDPKTAKRIAKKLCKGAVVNICACYTAKRNAKLQRMANKLQAKVCGCTGLLTRRCTCKGDWTCLGPNKQDDGVLKAREEQNDKPKKK